MAVVGYARVSTTDQSLDIQLQQLTAAGCDKLFSEKRTGTNLDRDEWQKCLTYLRDGDTLMVTRLDRLARSMGDFFKIVAELQAKGVKFKVLLQPEIDTTTANGRLVMGILACMAEFETEVRKARQREGIDRARAAGVYKNAPRNGRKAAASRLLNGGMSFTAVAERLNIPRRTLYLWFPDKIKNPRDKSTQDVPAALPAPPSAAEAVEPEATPETTPGKGGFSKWFSGR